MRKLFLLLQFMLEALTATVMIMIASSGTHSDSVRMTAAACSLVMLVSAFFTIGRLSELSNLDKG